MNTSLTIEWRVRSGVEYFLSAPRHLTREEGKKPPRVRVGLSFERAKDRQRGGFFVVVFFFALLVMVRRQTTVFSAMSSLFAVVNDDAFLLSVVAHV